jgi:inner membrane protein
LDSLTQLALGATIGEVTLGRKIGRKAMAWGALAGTLPDLDVLASPLLTAAQALRFHRGASHSLLFAPIVAPLLGLLVAWLYRRRSDAHADWRGWAWMFFWALWTHPLIDWLTIYGTQLFWPFSTHPLEAGALFIIDPLYTLPLLIALARSLFTPDSRTRLRWNQTALVVSTLYACWGLYASLRVEQLAWDSLRAQGLDEQVDEVLTGPAPLTTLAWNVLARGDSVIWTSRYAFLEADDQFAFEPISRHWSRTQPVRDTDAFQAVDWFSQGYGAARYGPDGQLRVHDLRFGRTLAPPGVEAEAGDVFRFEFYSDDGALTFRQLTPTADLGATLGAVWRRALGDDPAPNPPPPPAD